MEKIDVAVLGIGKMGETHVRSIEKLHKCLNL